MFVRWTSAPDLSGSGNSKRENMKGDRHTSKSKLNLRDGVGHKTGLQPHIGKSCEQSAKQCSKRLTGKYSFTKIAVN